MTQDFGLVTAQRLAFSLIASVLDGFTWLFPARLETSLCPRYAGRSKRLDFDSFNAK